MIYLNQCLVQRIVSGKAKPNISLLSRKNVVRQSLPEGARWKRVFLITLVHFDQSGSCRKLTSPAPKPALPREHTLYQNFEF